MKNNKGFGKFEVLTVIVILLCIFAFLAYSFLGGTSKQKVDTMKENALNFSKTVTTNVASFHNVDVVYLGEAIEEKVIGNIKNPFGSGNCDAGESKVTYRDGQAFVTLKCGEYLIEDEKFSDKEKVDIFHVGDWTTKKISKDYEKKKLYNCQDKGKDIYSDYYEELYLVAKVNKDYNTDYYFVDEIDICNVVSKTFYRTKVSIYK